MREFVFTLDYGPGDNPVADVLAAAPETRFRSLSCHVTPTTLWRVDHITGSESALDDVADAVSNAPYYADCLVRRDCEGEWETSVLDRSADTLVLYSYWERTPTCTSIPHLALEHLGQGLVFETTWQERAYQWRLILPNDRPISPFYRALEAEIDATAGVEIVRVREAGPNHFDEEHDGADRRLSPEQETALRAAVERGYYETPRAIETYELADELGIPGSTLSYRLRRAEATLAADYIEGLPATQPSRSNR
ncbi:helix-turn-helix domain-containing protein [Halococcus hamelinensis]|uniref:Bacterio-opsin activator HTH domain-containing protein n=1 Tax=Halococcus hamelinensis 100A6 TaxID=1132509 RepID=M0MC55_9EURY|nr:helix-turn-helix domain-containing protein [Halococcus hamelinensis]EMA42244.1 Bacterio-opsin activator HTH domain-containing protein [Halococcus hamelinensis 100A6]